MERPKDIRLDQEPIPSGQFLLEGRFLTNTVRPAKIPYGVVTRRTELPCGQHYMAAVGLVFFDLDKERVTALLAAKEESKKRRLLYPSQRKRS